MAPDSTGVRTRKSVDDLRKEPSRPPDRKSNASPLASKEPLTEYHSDPSQKQRADSMGPSPRSLARLRNPWHCSLLVFTAVLAAVTLAIVILQSFMTRQLDPKGCAMSLMRSRFYNYSSDFNTEHTRFASKYSLYLYREEGVDEDPRVSFHQTVLAKAQQKLNCSLGQRDPYSLHSGERW